MQNGLDRYTAHAPQENVARGTLMALITIPFGVMFWTLVWNFGLISSLVALAIAAAAFWLYRFGSGGRVGWIGVSRIAIIAIGTVLLAFAAGFLSEWVPVWMEATGASVYGTLTDRGFWSAVVEFSRVPSNGVILDFVVAIALGALGCLGGLARAFAEARANAKIDVTLPHPDDPIPEVR